MDYRRPESATSTTSISTHKRAASRKVTDVKTAESNVICLFVKNVRLLNLDLLPDWPAITPSSFSSLDARTRIRCTEWCLYQLFHVYDPATTGDKLQPFFPPLEPLQSINLRAALYRCLNELKKNGVLGRETVLRKSMLDDCQGEKFFELCLSFSGIVLRKVTVDKHNGNDSPIAERIATAESLRKSQRESMLPLAIAHRAALTRVLSEKERKRQTFGRLYHVMMDKEIDLRERKGLVQEQGRGRTQKKSAVAEEVLEKDWVGSDELRSALVNGDDGAGSDSILTRPFESIWDANKEKQLFSSTTADQGVLEDLNHRVRYQKRRLQKWQSFQEKLLGSKSSNTKGGHTANKSHGLQFDQHQNLTLRDMEQNPPSPPSPTKFHQKHDSVTKYDEILTAMREELRKKSVVQNAPVPETEATPRARPQSYRKPSVSHDFAIKHEPHQRSNSQTAVPMRPIFGKRMSSRSRSYQQPKVISQREPIPLKSEIFSPLKTKRSSISPSSSGRMSMLASPVEDPSINAQLDDAIAGAARRMRQDSDISSINEGLGISSTSTPTRGNSGTSTPKSARSSIGNPDSAIELPSRMSNLGVAGRNMDSMGRTVRPSLADRTRMSMAFKSADDLGSINPEVQQGSNTGTADAADSPHLRSEPLLDRRPTLHERTRQSLSLAPQPASAPTITKRASIHARSRTAYPINQFETPQKDHAPRRSTVGTNHLEAEDDTPQRSITPREKLFEQDAEYASIFKPRPKVALSPVMSPSFVDDSSVENMGMSSPLTGRNE
ncbi:hypothetical protein PRZ48_009487 [Zasmidium cellare]|uniref:HAUS augmin-like complex subunit 6 N-terminal domain-containing protein n=1 Tax=Zasmidium cellare TaxID=395010 RepID=A0ABR0EBV9_ZASCE|nr:hypothetical protein PRZ48_009487 [Zasmidium cellare]